MFLIFILASSIQLIYELWPMGHNVSDNEGQHWINENSARYENFDTDYRKFRYFRRQNDTIRYMTSNLYFDISKQHYPIRMRYNQFSANCGSTFTDCFQI